MKALHALVGLVVLLLSVSSSSAVTLHATDDTNVNLAQPGQINGASVDVFVRNVGTGGERHGYVKFDTSLIAQNTPIEQAQARLWVSAVSTAGPVDFYVATSSWDEATLSAGIQPSREATPFATKNIVAGDINSYVIVDVTSVVREWVNGTKQNFGIALLPNPAGVRVTLNSKENTGTSHPMEVEAAVAGPHDISARVFNNADITIPNSVATMLTFNSESWDTDNLHDTAVNTSRLSATTAGRYYIYGHVLWASNANGLRQLRIRMNGNKDIATIGYPAVSDAGVGTFMSISTHHELAVGNYVELEVQQLSGGPLNIQVSEGQAGEFGMAKFP